ncbi:hypothetical protein [Leeuwenhoekiella sp. H156]|uniref:hypothetical protein n=1 Tax=Leeuwenhoekiella sp. H156 TaxID=3450128 RepID=UPI003FA4A5E4
MGLTRFKSILAAAGAAWLSLIYILAPVQQHVLEWAHQWEHEFYHITSSSHEHGFLSADQLLAEAGHDHRTLEYIKQVLEPFEDDLQKEQDKKTVSFKLDKHLQAEKAHPAFAPQIIISKAKYSFFLHEQKLLALRIPVPPPQV